MWSRAHLTVLFIQDGGSATDMKTDKSIEGKGGASCASFQHLSKINKQRQQ